MSNFDPNNWQSKFPSPSEDTVRVATQNLENYDTTLSGRGAKSYEELAIQESKLTKTLATIKADLYGLTELDNTSADTGLKRLTQNLSKETGKEYKNILTGKLGEWGSIKTGIIYNPAKLEPQGNYRTLDYNSSRRFDPSASTRPILIQEFTHKQSGEEVVVLVAHLKSKLKREEDPGNSFNSARLEGSNWDFLNKIQVALNINVGRLNREDASINRSANEFDRVQSALAIQTWIAKYAQGKKVIVLGDLNAGLDSQTVDTFNKFGLKNTVTGHIDDPKSYRYKGKDELIDHILVSPKGIEVKKSYNWTDNLGIADDDPIKKDPRYPQGSSDHGANITDLLFTGSYNEYKLPLAIRIGNFIRTRNNIQSNRRESKTLKYMTERGINNLYTIQGLKVIPHGESISQRALFRTKELKYNVRSIDTVMPNYAISLPNEHFNSYGDRLPQVSTFETLYRSRVAVPSKDSYAYGQYNNDIITLQKFDTKISTPTIGQYINWKLGNNLYTPGYGITGSISSYVGRQFDNLFGFDDMMLQRDAIERKKIIRVKQFISLHDQPPKDKEIGQFETIFNTTQQTASGIALAIGTYTSINLPIQHIKAKFEDMFTEQLLAPGKAGWGTRPVLNWFYFGGSLGIAVTDATTKVYQDPNDPNNKEIDPKTGKPKPVSKWKIDPKTGKYISPTSRSVVGSNLRAIQADIITAKTRLENNLINEAIKRGAQISSDLDYKGKLIASMEYLDDSTFNQIKDKTLIEIRAEEINRLSKGKTVDIAHVDRSTAYLNAITATSREQLLEGKVVIGTSTDLFSYFGAVGAFRKYDTSRFDLLLAPILRNINPYEFSTNPDSAFGVFNASINEFRRTLSLGIHLVYDPEAKGAVNSVRLANTGVQRNMELAKSLDRIGHLLPVNMFYWMPSVRKALKLPAFDNRENIVWADIFSIEQKTKEVEATMNFISRAAGIRWHNITPEPPKNGLLRLGVRTLELVKSIAMPFIYGTHTLSRTIQLYAQQRLTDNAYRELEKKVLKPLHKEFYELIDEDTRIFSESLEEADNTFKKINITETGFNLDDDLEGKGKPEDLLPNRKKITNRKGRLLLNLIELIEDKVLGAPIEKTKKRRAYYTIGQSKTPVNVDDPEVNELIQTYQDRNRKLAKIRKRLVSIGIVEVQEVVNPLDREANAGKRHLSLDYKPSDSKKIKLGLLTKTLGIAGTVLLTDAVMDFAFLNAGVSIFDQMKARHTLTLHDLQKAEGLSDDELDHASRGVAHFKFKGELGHLATFGTATSLGVLGGLLFPTTDSPKPKYQLDAKFVSVEEELEQLKLLIDHLDKQTDTNVQLWTKEFKEELKGVIGKDLARGKVRKSAYIWEEVSKLRSVIKLDADSEIGIKLREYQALTFRANDAIATVNSIEKNRQTYRFNKKTAWGGFVLGLLAARLAGGVVAGLAEWRYNEEPNINKMLKLIQGKSLNDRPELDAISSVMTSYTEKAAGDLARDAVTVKDLVIAAALERKSYTSFKLTEDNNQVYNIATQATLPFFQLAMVGRVNAQQRTISLGTAFQLNATLGLGISPILPIAIRLGEPTRTTEQQQQDLKIQQQELEKFSDNPLSDRTINRINKYQLINTLTVGDSFVYDKNSNFESAITFLGASSLLGRIANTVGYMYERGNLRSNLKVNTAVKSYTRWVDAMPVATARALLFNTTKNLITLPVFFMDASIRATRRSKGATALGLAGASHFILNKTLTEKYDSTFRTSHGLEKDSDIPEELRSDYELLKAGIQMGSFGIGLVAGAFITPSKVGEGHSKVISPFRTKINQFSRSGLTLGLATYTGLFVGRMISAPDVSFKGYSTLTDENAYEATVGIGATLGLGFLSQGVFSSEESLLEAYKARLQASPDYKSKLIYELNKIAPEGLINSEYGQDIINNLVREYESNNTVGSSLRPKRMLMSTSNLRNMVGSRLFEEGQRLGASDLNVIPSGRYNLLSSRLTNAYFTYALTRLASLAVVSLASAEQRDSLYQVPYLGESLKVLSGVGGFDNEDTFKYNYQPSFFNKFLPELVKIFSFNILNMEPYQDKSDPFFNLIGSFGLSFKQTGVSSYFQLASTSTDLSISGFNLAMTKLSDLDTFKDVVQSKGVDPKTLYTIVRGRKARSTPIGFVPIGEDTQQALGGSLGLSTALDIRLLKQSNLAFQRPDEIAQDLYIEGLKTGRIAHPFFKDFANNKLPLSRSSLDLLKDGQFFLGQPGSELMVDENGEVVVRKESQLVYKPEFLQDLFQDTVFFDRTITSQTGITGFLGNTFTGLSDALGESVLSKVGLGVVAPFLTTAALTIAGISTITTLGYLARRRETLELFEESYMSRSTVIGQASRYQFKILKLGEKDVIAQIDLSTGREGKMFALAYLDELYAQTDNSTLDKETFGKKIVENLSTSQTRLINQLNTFFDTDINKEVQVLLEELNEYYENKTGKSRTTKTFGPERVQQLTDNLKKTLTNRLLSVLDENLQYTRLKVGEFLYEVYDLTMEQFIDDLIDNPNSSITKGLSNSLMDTINQYSRVAATNPELLEAAVGNLTNSKAYSLTQAIDMLRITQGVNKAIDPRINHYTGQLVYQLTEPRLNTFEIEDVRLGEDVQKGQADYETHQNNLKKQAKLMATNKGLYGKRVWGETFLSDIGNYGFGLVGRGINSYLQYIQPLYETLEGVSIGLDANKSVKERERGYTWGLKFGAYNAASFAIASTVSKMGLGGIPATLIGVALQVGAVTLLQRDPTYTTREHEFFKGIADKLVPDDGSKGVHLTPIAKVLNHFTSQITGPLLAEIHAKDKSLASQIIFGFILPQTQYIEEWNIKQNARAEAIDRFKQLITIKTSPTSEYIHPELMGKPLGLIQEVRYHRYFKTNAFGGRALSQFNMGAYRPSGLLTLALSRRQAISEHYIGYSMQKNILREASRPPDEETFKKLGYGILNLAYGLAAWAFMSKIGITYAMGAVADFTVGSVSGSMANTIFGPKHEAVRQARFILDDAARMLGIDPNKMPVVQYGGVEVTNTFYENGRIVLSHDDAVKLASRRTSKPDTLADAGLKQILTHELIHHQQYDKPNKQFEDLSITEANKKVRQKPLRQRTHDDELELLTNETTDLDEADTTKSPTSDLDTTISKSSVAPIDYSKPIIYSELTGGQLTQHLEDIRDGKITGMPTFGDIPKEQKADLEKAHLESTKFRDPNGKPSSPITSARAKNILTSAELSTIQAIQTAEDRGIILSQSQRQIIYHNEVQAHFLASEVIEVGNVDRLDPGLDRLTDKANPTRGLSNPSYIVGADGKFISDKQYEARAELTQTGGYSSDGNKLYITEAPEEQIGDGTFTRRYVSDGSSQGLSNSQAENKTSDLRGKPVPMPSTIVENVNKPEYIANKPTELESMIGNMQTQAKYVQSFIEDGKLNLKASPTEIPKIIQDIDTRIEQIEADLATIKTSPDMKNYNINGKSIVSLVEDLISNLGILRNNASALIVFEPTVSSSLNTASTEITRRLVAIKANLESSNLDVSDIPKLKTDIRDILTELNSPEFLADDVTRSHIFNEFYVPTARQAIEAELTYRWELAEIQNKGFNKITNYIQKIDPGFLEYDGKPTSLGKLVAEINKKIEANTTPKNIPSSDAPSSASTKSSTKVENTDLLGTSKLKKPLQIVNVINQNSNKVSNLLQLRSILLTNPYVRLLVEEYKNLAGEENKAEFIDNYTKRGLPTPEESYKVALQQSKDELNKAINEIIVDQNIGLSTVSKQHTIGFIQLMEDVNRKEIHFIDNILTNEQKATFNSLTESQQRVVLNEFLWGDKIYSPNVNLSDVIINNSPNPSIARKPTSPEKPLVEDTPTIKTSEQIDDSIGNTNKNILRALNRYQNLLFYIYGDEDIQNADYLKQGANRAKFVEFHELYEKRAQLLTEQRDIEYQQKRLKTIDYKISQINKELSTVRKELKQKKKEQVKLNEPKELDTTTDNKSTESNSQKGKKKGKKQQTLTLEEQIKQYEAKEQKLTKELETQKQQQAASKTHDVLETELANKKLELEVNNEELRAVSSKLEQDLDINIKHIDSPTFDGKKPIVEAGDINYVGSQIKIADEAIKKTNAEIQEHLKLNPSDHKPNTNWEEHSASAIRRVNVPNPKVEANTNYIKRVVRQFSESINSALQNAEVPRLTLSPVQLLGDTANYVKTFATAFSSVHGDINAGKVLVGGLGTFDVYTTYNLKTDTNNELRTIYIKYKNGHITEEEAIKYFTRLRQSEVASNLSTGTSTTIGLFSNSFLGNLVPSLLVGWLGNRQMDNQSKYVQELVAQDMQALKDEKGDYAIPSDRTISISSTLKSYRENKVLTKLIEENDVLQKSIGKVFKLESIGSAISYTGNLLFGSRLSRFFVGGGATLGFYKLVQGEKEKYQKEWEQLDAFQKAQWGNKPERYYETHRNRFLQGGLYLSALSAGAEALNMTFSLLAYVTEGLFRFIGDVTGSIINKADVRNRARPLSVTEDAVEEIADELGAKPGDSPTKKVGDGADSINPDKPLKETTEQIAEELGNDVKLTGQEELAETQKSLLQKMREFFGWELKHEPRPAKPIKPPSKLGQWWKDSKTNLGDWWDNVSYGATKRFQDIGASISSFAPIKGLTDTIRGMKVGFRRKVLSPIKKGFKWFFQKSFNLVAPKMPKLDTYLAHKGLRGAVVDTLGPTIDITSYLFNSHAVGTLNRDSAAYEFPTYYQESGRAAGSLGGSIAGMRSSGFVADIIFSLANAEMFGEEMKELGIKRREYISYYDQRKVLGKSLLQYELDLLTVQEARTNAQLGNSLNPGLGLVLDMYRKTQAYKDYYSGTVDAAIHAEKLAKNGKYFVKGAKFKRLGIAGLVAKGDKERRALHETVMGAEKYIEVNRLKRVENIRHLRSVVNYTSGGAKKGKALLDIFKTSAKVASVGDGTFRGLLGSNVLGLVVDTAMFGFSALLENQAIDIVDKDKSLEGQTAALELFEQGQQLKGSAVFSVVGTGAGAVAGAGFGPKGMQVGSALGGLIGGAIGEEIGRSTVQAVRDTKGEFTDYAAVGRGQNIGLGVGVGVGIAAILTLLAVGVTLPLWAIGLGAAAIIAGGYTMGGMLPIHMRDGFSMKGLAGATGDTFKALGKGVLETGKSGVKNTIRFGKWVGKTGVAIGGGIKAIGSKLGSDFMDAVRVKPHRLTTGRQQPQYELKPKSIPTNQVSQVGKERNWIDRILFPDASANELDDYLKAKEQNQTKVTTTNQYLNNVDPYKTLSTQEILDKQNQRDPKLDIHLQEHLRFEQKSEGFFAKLKDSKWYKGIARVFSFIFSPVALLAKHGFNFLKHMGQKGANAWNAAGNTLNNWKEKIGSFWNKITNKLGFGSDYVHDPYAKEREHQHKFVGRILKSIGINYNAVPDVQNIRTLEQLYSAFGASMGWKNLKDAEVAVRMGISEYGSNAVTVATVLNTTRNRQIAIESGNSNIAVKPSASVSWGTIVSASGQYQVFRDGSMARVEINTTNIQKVAQASAIVTSGQLVNKLMTGEGITRALSKQEAENVANSTAFSVPGHLDSRTWHAGQVTVSSSDGLSHVYAHSSNTKMNYIQIAQTKYPSVQIGKGGNQKPSGFNAGELMGALRDNVTFYSTFSPSSGDGVAFGPYQIVNSDGSRVKVFEDLRPHWAGTGGYTRYSNDPRMKSGRVSKLSDGRLVYDFILKDSSGNASVPMPAIASGLVIKAGGAHGSVYIKDDQGFIHEQVHMSNISVKEGQRVAYGQIIGIQASVGPTSTGIHLHAVTNEATLRRFVTDLTIGFTPTKEKNLTSRGLTRSFTTDEEVLISRQFNQQRAPQFIRDAEARGYRKQTMATKLVNTTFKDPKSGRTIQLQEEAWYSFQQMALAAQAEGINLGILSGFRGLNQQAELLKANANKTNAQILNSQAPVGYSQHHTGLAVDIGTMQSGLLKEGTKEYNWLVQNASKYNFQLSYSKGSNQGAGFEPWEWRYTGTTTEQAKTEKSSRLTDITDQEKRDAINVLKPNLSFTPAMVEDLVGSLRGAGRPQSNIDYLIEQIDKHNASLSEKEQQRLVDIKTNQIKDPYAELKIDRNLQKIPAPNVISSEGSSTTSTDSSASSSSGILSVPKLPSGVKQLPGNLPPPPPLSAQDQENLRKLEQTFRETHSQFNTTNSGNTTKPLVQTQLERQILDKMNRFNRSGNIRYLDGAINIVENYIKKNPNDNKAKQELQRLRGIHNNTPKPGPLRRILNILGSKDLQNAVAYYQSAQKKNNNSKYVAYNKFTEAELGKYAIATDEELEDIVARQKEEVELIKDIRVVAAQVNNAVEHLKQESRRVVKIEGNSNVKEAPVDNNQTIIVQKPKEAKVKVEQSTSKNVIKIEVSQPGQYVLEQQQLMTSVKPSNDYTLMDNNA